MRSCPGEKLVIHQTTILSIEFFIQEYLVNSIFLCNPINFPFTNNNGTELTDANHARIKEGAELAQRGAQATGDEALRIAGQLQGVASDLEGSIKTAAPVDLAKLDMSNIPELSALVAGHLSKNERFPSPEAAFMAIPIMRHGEPRYIFCLGAGSHQPYSDDDISLAQLVISQAALLFEREKSRGIAET